MLIDQFRAARNESRRLGLPLLFKVEVIASKVKDEFWKRDRVLTAYWALGVIWLQLGKYQARLTWKIGKGGSKC